MAQNFVLRTVVWTLELPYFISTYILYSSLFWESIISHQVTNWQYTHYEGISLKPKTQDECKFNLIILSLNAEAACSNHFFFFDYTWSICRVLITWYLENVNFIHSNPLMKIIIVFSISIFGGGGKLNCMLHFDHLFFFLFFCLICMVWS